MIIESYNKDFTLIKDEHEKRIAKLLKNMDLNFLASNLKIYDEGSEIGEVDLLYTFKESLFLIEVTSKSKEVNKKADFWFSRFNYEKNVNVIKKEFSIPYYKIKFIFIDLSHNSDNKDIKSIMHHLDKKDNIFLFKDDVQYFEKEINQIGILTRNDFLNLIKIEREKKSKEINAIKFYIKDTPAYSFIARVDELLETCYIQRRYNNDEGYQRALDYERIRNISDQINKEKIIAFPNSIIVNSERKIGMDQYTKEDCPKTSPINLPISYCELKVVDGQHRLLGFSKVDQVIQKQSYLPVIAFENLDKRDEIKMFVDINSKQKRVDQNLVLYLKKSFEWNISDKEYYEKMSVQIAEYLEKQGPLKNKIYFGRAREERKNKITLSTIVTLLTGNRFINKRYGLWQNYPEDIETPLKNTSELLNNINLYLSSFKINNINFFLQNRGLRIMFRFIRIIEKNRLADNITISNKEIIQDLNGILDDDLTTLLSGSYGEGGAKAFTTILIKKLIDNNKNKYKKLEIDLNKLKHIKKINTEITTIVYI